MNCYSILLNCWTIWIYLLTKQKKNLDKALWWRGRKSFFWVCCVRVPCKSSSSVTKKKYWNCLSFCCVSVLFRSCSSSSSHPLFQITTTTLRLSIRHFPNETIRNNNEAVMFDRTIEKFPIDTNTRLWMNANRTVHSSAGTRSQKSSYRS